MTDAAIKDLVQFGAVGIFLIALIFGQVAPGYIVKQKDARIGHLETQLDQRDEFIRERALPALIKSTEATVAVVQALSDRSKQ